MISLSIGLSNLILISSKYCLTSNWPVTGVTHTQILKLGKTRLKYNFFLLFIPSSVTCWLNMQIIFSVRPLLILFLVFTSSAQFTDKETELERFWYFKLGIVRGYSRDKEPGQGRWDQSDDTVRGELGNKREDILRVLRTWPYSVFYSCLF